MKHSSQTLVGRGSITLPGVGFGEVSHSEDSGNMQSSFQRGIKGKLSLYNMEVSSEHSTRAAGGSACPGKIELLRGLKVSKAWQCLGERPGSLAATLFCSEFQKE